MFERIISWVKGVMGKMFNLRDDTKISGGASIAVSSEMATAIQRWHDEYTGKAYWLKHDDKTLNLPARVASEMAGLVTLEATINVSGSKRAEYLAKQLEPFIENMHTNVEYACAMGGIVMKPYPDGNNIAIDYVHVDDFYPIAFNSRREITSAVFVERKQVGNVTYSRVEHHDLKDSGYTITNKCFKGYSDNDVGQEVPLGSVDEWADIQPVVTMKGIDVPLFSYFRIPLGNTIDPKSPLGVSVYANAETNMREADKQYQRMLWEFEGGELAIDAAEDVFDFDKKGNVILPVGKERLYRTNKLGVHSNSDAVFKTFSPSLRDESLINGLNEILAKVEDLTGLARGTLSDRLREVRTATEIKFSRQRTYTTVTGIQKSLQKAIEALVQAMDILATLYNLAPTGDYQVNCRWDDSVLTDSDTERVRDQQEVREGLMHKYEFRMKWYGEDEDTARRMAAGDEMSDEEILFGDRTKNPPKQE